MSTVSDTLPHTTPGGNPPGEPISQDFLDGVQLPHADIICQVEAESPTSEPGSIQVKPLVGFEDGWGRRRWIAAQNIPGPFKAVLNAMELYADVQTGECFPKVDTLAKASGFDRRTVTRGATWLEEHGYLVRVERMGRSNTYVLAMPPGANGAESVTPDSESYLPKTVSHTPQDTQSYITHQGTHHLKTPKNNARGESLKWANFTDVPQEFLNRMMAKYSGKPSEEVLDTIMDAMAHKSRLKWDDTGRYIQGWLNREFKDRPQFANASRGGTRVEPTRDGAALKKAWNQYPVGAPRE